MIDVFCASCGELILDRANCPACGWRRPAGEESAGAVVWSADLRTRLSKPHCYPVVAGGYYCLGTEDGTLLALDLTSGRVAWERSLGKGCMAHALTTDGERLLVGCEDVRPIPAVGKDLLALDVATGEEAWHYPVEAHSLSAAAVEGGTVYLTSSNGLLHAVDATSGERRWAVEHPLWGPTAPAAGEGVVCAGGRDTTLVAYAAADGKELWRISAAGWFATLPLIALGRVYALCWDDHLYALDARSGELVWKLRGERGKGLTTPPAVADDHVFVGSRVHVLQDREPAPGYAMLALLAADGSEVWRFHTEKHIFSPPAVGDGTVFFGSNDGLFYAVGAAGGQEHWRVQVKSRAVTRPQAVGELVIFGGRDGMVHAVRWRARPAERVLAPSTYRRRGELDLAAAAHALRGEFDKAAALYEELGRREEAARLHERAGQPGEAARLWQGLGGLKRARDLYRAAGATLELAGLLELMDEPLEAARLYEEIGNLEEAARLYELAGDRPKAAELHEQVGQYGKSQEIWASLGDWERQVESLTQEGKHVDAARVLEEHGHLERAADLYEEGGELGEALRVEVELERWEHVVDLATSVGDLEQVAEAHERLGQPQRAAEAYVQVAESLEAAETPDGERVAALYERAADLYETVYREREALDCRWNVRRCRRLPEVAVRGKAREAFVENAWSVLDLDVENVGFGVACNIHVSFSDNFETWAEETIRGLLEGEHRPVVVHAKPHKGQYGAAVPLNIIVAYDDLNGNPYRATRVTSVHVVAEDSLMLPGRTPLEFHVHGDFYQPGAKKVDGHEVQAGGQVGDRVEIRRGEGHGLVLESGETGARVEARRGARPVRRCPNPECNVPTDDPELQNCTECGAPLNSVTDD